MDKEKNEGKITKEEFAENKNVFLQTIILNLVKELFSLSSYSGSFTMICPSRVGLKDYNYQCIRVEECLGCWKQAIEQGGGTMTQTSSTMACNCNPEKQTCNLCGKTIAEVNKETTENAKNRQSYLKIVRKFNKRKARG